MKSYVISYDLNKPGQDYAKLYEAIKSYGTWWRNLESTWIIKSNSIASQIRDYLKQFIDKNDKLLVVTLTGEGAWSGINANGSTWLTKYL